MRRMLRFTWPRAVVVLALALAGTALGLWLTPSGDYLLLPHEARPVAPLVSIDGRTDTVAEGAPGIYMVDVLLARANMLEQLLPVLRADGQLVPQERLNPQGVSENQRRQTQQLDMTRSQQIAAAVALQELGYEVEAEPEGAQVVSVLPGSPADGRLSPGDVIVEANGNEVATPGDLRAAMQALEPGTQASLVIRNGQETRNLSLPTVADEDDPTRAVIGVIVEQAATFDLPVPISIDADSVVGPSAGLAFALDIVDELGTDVDQGRRVVVTGELELDGSVAAVGGVKQKAIGAQRAGADVFVVPEANAAEARANAGGVEVVAVGTFDEALTELGVEPEPVS